MLIFATIGDGDSMLGLGRRWQKLNKKGNPLYRTPLSDIIAKRFNPNFRVQ